MRNVSSDSVDYQHCHLVMNAENKKNVPNLALWWYASYIRDAIKISGLCHK